MNDKEKEALKGLGEDFKKFGKLPKLKQKLEIDKLKSFVDFLIFMEKRKISFEDTKILIQIIGKDFMELFFVIEGYRNLREATIGTSILLKGLIQTYKKE